MFLKLAEEARNSELVYDRPSVVNTVHSQWFGRSRRTMITEIIDRFPKPGSEDSRVSRTSTEVSPDLNHVDPIVQLGPMDDLENTAELMMLGAKMNDGKISHPGRVGPDEELLMDSGPAGLVRTRCPVGTVMLPALRNEVRPAAGSPVDTSPDPGFKKCHKNSSGNDSYQPFVTGPSGANVSDDGQDTGQPRVSDPMTRPTSLDPKGTREILSLGEGYQSPTICSKNLSPDNSYQPLVTGPSGANVSEDGHDTGQPRVRDPWTRLTSLHPMDPSEVLSMNNEIQLASIGPVDRPWMTGQLVSQPGSPGYEQLTHDRSESEGYDESIHSVARMAVEIDIGHMTITMGSGRTEISKDSYSSDSVITNPESVIDRTESESECDAVALAPVSLSRGKCIMIIGLSSSSGISPSSDSGIHSYDEQWGILSTKSRNSDSIQSSGTVQSIVVSPVDKRIVPVREMDTSFDRSVVQSLQENLVRHGSMSYLSTTGHNSDVAAMADFSDDEDDPWEDVETCDEGKPTLQTDSVNNETIKNVTGSYEYALLHKIPPVAVPHDPDDEFRMDYWINFRTLLNKALTLDDITLSENDYPEIVKAFIFRYRWTLLVREERKDVRLTELYESDEEEDEDLSEMYFRHKLEKYWNYHDDESRKLDNEVTDECFKLIGNTGEAGFHDMTVDIEIEDKMDVESEPDARARIDVSPTTDVGDLVNFSMILVDRIQTDTSERIHKALVVTECVTRPILFTSRDFEVCRQDTGWIMRTYCFGLCGSSNKFVQILNGAGDVWTY